MSVVMDDYRSSVENSWCPGCGNFGILTAIKKALVGLALPPDRVLFCTGIGQAPKLPHYMRVNTFNGLHGREVAAGSAAKLAADDLTVVVHAGEGGGYGEGGNHLLHAIRRDIDITLIVHDNKIYGLTKGQASPTSRWGQKTVLQPYGLAVRPLNPLALALSQGCGFVAQGLSTQTDLLVDLMTKAITHRGFSLLNVLQPCVSWDKVHTYAYYNQHGYTLGGEHDPSHLGQAFALVTTEEERIPLGLVYEKEATAYQDRVLKGIEHPLRDRQVEPQRALDLQRRFQ
jgi:2-oxoglutarate ferredoxin oxidoreductase subunit beta